MLKCSALTCWGGGLVQHGDHIIFTSACVRCPNIAAFMALHSRAHAPADRSPNNTLLCFYIINSRADKLVLQWLSGLPSLFTIVPPLPFAACLGSLSCREINVGAGARLMLRTEVVYWWWNDKIAFFVVRSQTNWPHLLTLHFRIVRSVSPSRSWRASLHCLRTEIQCLSNDLILLIKTYCKALIIFKFNFMFDACSNSRFRVRKPRKPFRIKYDTDEHFTWWIKKLCWFFFFLGL